MAPARKLVGQEDEVVSAFLAGATYSELAARFGVSASTIGRVLAGAEIDNFGRIGRRPKLFGREHEVVAGFREGKTASELAAEFAIDRRAITRLLNAAGVQRTSGPWRKPPEVEQAIADAYAAGASLNEVAQQFGYSRTLVKRAVLEHGGTIRSKGRPRSPSLPASPARRPQRQASRSRRRASPVVR